MLAEFILHRRVQVYWNRHKRRWSVRDKQTRKVIGHAVDCVLHDCVMHVSQAGVARCRRTGRHEVIAWIEGTIKRIDDYWDRKFHAMNTGRLCFKDRLEFFAMTNDSFVTHRKKTPIDAASVVLFCLRPTAWREAGEVWFNP